MKTTKITNPDGLVLKKIYSANNALFAVIVDETTHSEFTLCVEDDPCPTSTNNNERPLCTWHDGRATAKLFRTGCEMIPPHI